uniref:G-protein coupled receptors family 1 profile domain-containing protein n=1 Tax=Equus asinus TaxID=9793 RepID=A0A9L0JNT0_EQUAS
MSEENTTLVTEFVLTGLTERPGLQAPLFLVFLLTYLTTMVGNLGLAALIWKDPRLHSPMYLFLGSLAFADACSSSSVTPRMLINFLSKNHKNGSWRELKKGASKLITAYIYNSTYYFYQNIACSTIFNNLYI